MKKFGEEKWMQIASTTIFKAIGIFIFRSMTHPWAPLIAILNCNFCFLDALRLFFFWQEKKYSCVCVDTKLDRFQARLDTTRR